MTRSRVAGVLVILVTLALIAFTVGTGPGFRNGGSAPERLSTLTKGQWVKIVGVVRPDSAARCDELKILMGDFLDDDWALKGIARAPDTLKREFSVCGIGVQVTENTAFDSPVREFRVLSDVHDGQLVDAEGAWLMSGRLLAREVDDESNEVARRPWDRNRIVVVGKVGNVDPRKRLVSVMGLLFEVTEQTRLRSAIE